MSGNRDFNDPGNSGRTEPKLGNLDQLHGPQPPVEPDDGLPRIQVEPAYRRGEPNGRDPYRKRHRWILPTLIVVLLAAVGGLWFNQTRRR